MTYKNWKKSIISETDTISGAIKNLSSTGFQICLVIDKKKN